MSTATGGTVLLLEHDDSVREVPSLLLTEDGHDVQACTSAREIVDRAAAMPHALAVIDCAGPSHAALVPEERVYLADLARSLPTVLVTGWSWATEAMAEESGLAALVRQPFDVGELSDVVRARVEKLRANGEAARGRARQVRARTGVALERLEQSRERLQNAAAS